MAGPTRNMFLALDYDESTKKTLMDTLLLPLSPHEIRREKRRNLHLTVGYIRSIPPQDRRQVIHAFDFLEKYRPFTLHAEATVELGPHANILCLRFGPFEALAQLREHAEALLSRSTPYQFDRTYKEYIPHTKIQTIRSHVSGERRSEIMLMFKELPYRKLNFKIKSVALMERHEDNYVVVKRYIFSKTLQAHSHDSKCPPSPLLESDL